MWVRTPPSPARPRAGAGAPVGDPDAIRAASSPTGISAPITISDTPAATVRRGPVAPRGAEPKPPDELATGCVMGRFDALIYTVTLL